MDIDGNELEEGTGLRSTTVAGNAAILYGDDERFVSTYFERFGPHLRGR